MTELNFNSSEYITNFKNQNFKIVKCYNAFTALKNNWNNIGFWIFLFLMILNIILSVLYCLAQKEFKPYLSKLLRKYGYIGESDEGHAFCHNYIKKLDRLIQKLKEEKNKFFEMHGKGNNPPKKRNRNKTIKKENSINTNSLATSKNESLIKKSSNSLKKKNYEKEIKELKKRMEKTKRNEPNKINIYKNSNNILFEGRNIYKRKTDSKNNPDIKEENDFKLNLININVSEPKKNLYIPNNSEQVLNIYEFKEAIKYDKRSICTINYFF